MLQNNRKTKKKKRNPKKGKQICMWENVQFNYHFSVFVLAMIQNEHNSSCVFNCSCIFFSLEFNFLSHQNQLWQIVYFTLLYSNYYNKEEVLAKNDYHTT